MPQSLKVMGKIAPELGALKFSRQVVSHTTPPPPPEVSCDACHAPNPALHVSLLPAAKQAIVASRTANISLICHQYTDTICAAEAPWLFNTCADAMYAAARDGDHHYREKKGMGTTA